MSEQTTQHRGIVAWWARNSVAANLLMVFAFIGGIIGFSNLEKEVFPQADFNGVSVSIVWPGASPQDIEDQLVTRLEEVMADLQDDIKRMDSTAREGVGYLQLITRNDTDLDRFLDDVKLRVDQINNLPLDAFEPQVQRMTFDGNWFMGLVLHGDIDALSMKRLTEQVRDEIAQLRGGELVRSMGALDEEVKIQVSEEALRRYGLTFSEVANAVRGASLNSSGGTVRGETGNISLQTRALANSAEEFGNIVIRQSLDGGTIRVRDVAEVIDGFVDADVDSTFNKRRATFLMMNPPERMDIVAYTDTIKEYVEKANSETLPEGVRIDLLFDDSEVYKGRMNTIANAAFLGSLMVLVVLILFLRPVVAMWVTVGILTAFAGGFAILPMFGVSLNMLSLFAVLLVIGVIVDDAIIVGENIHSEVESGRRQGVDAAIVATQLVVKPVLFGVITTMIMFGPWAFLAGNERQFTQQISFVVVSALIFSLIESMLILPAHLSHMKPQTFEGAKGGFLRFQRNIADSLLWFAHHVFKPVLETAIKFRYATAALFAVLFLWAVTLMQTGLVGWRFMPEIEADLVFVSIRLPDGTSHTRALAVKDQLYEGMDFAEETLREEYPNVEGKFIRDASVVVDGRNIQSWISITKPEDRPKSMSTKEFADAIRAGTGDIPDAEDVSFQFTFNDSDTGIRYALSHHDLDILRRATDEVRAQLATYETTYDFSDNLSSAAPEVRLSLKSGVEALGLTLGDVSQQVRQAYFGEIVQRLPRNGDDVEVKVLYPEEARRSLDSLEQLRIRTADGREIPLYEAAETEFAPGVNAIHRRDRERTVIVGSELSGDVRGQIVEDMNKNFWPGFEARYPNMKHELAGTAQEEADFASNLVVLNLIAMGIMYFLLAIAFRSYFQPLLIMTAIPFGFAGAAFGHLAFDIPLAMFSMFGIAAAAGVVINDNLVLVDLINRRRDEGYGAVQSIVDAATSRFRPILLTSVTTFVGVLPMIAEQSMQAQFLKPMVVSMGCAVGFALFVSLFMVPSLYAVGVEIGRFFQWAWSGKPYRRIGETYSGEISEDFDDGHGSRVQPAE